MELTVGAPVGAHHTQSAAVSAGCIHSGERVRIGLHSVGLQSVGDVSE